MKQEEAQRRLKKAGVSPAEIAGAMKLFAEKRIHERGDADPWFLFFTARDLKKASFDVLGWDLLFEAVRNGNPTSNVPSDAIPFALRKDLERGLALLAEVEVEDTSLRLSLFKKVLSIAKARAVPLAVQALCATWDAGTEYDFVTHQKYVTRMFDMLAPFDLRPHVKRIEEAFAKEKDKKVLAAVASGLAKWGGKKIKAPKPVAFQSPPKPYDLDTYAASIGREVVQTILEHRASIPIPITEIVLQRMPETIRVMGVSVRGEDGEETFDLEGPKKCQVPGDFSDRRMAKIFVRHGFSAKDEELPAWGDDFQLPGCAYILELLEELGRIVVVLRKKGVKVARSVERSAFGEWSDDDGWEDLVKQALEVCGDNAVLVREVAAQLYASSKRRKWLMGLATMGE